MNSKDNEYKEIFYSEAIENQDELNRLLTALEKNSSDKKTIDEIFRIVHTLKGNAMGLGFTGIAEMSHALEDLFIEIKNGKITLTTEIIDNIFKANDKLSELIQALKTDKKVVYKGIRTKLEVLLKNALGSKEVYQDIENEPFEESNSSELTNVAEIIDDVEELEENVENKITFSDQIQVSVSKLDNLLNLVGELIIEKDSLVAKATTSSIKLTNFSRLHRITSDIQYAVMDVRLIQVGFFLNKFHRIVRDAANMEGKKVNLTLKGTEIEIDRNILKIISDSLVHMVRNSVGHGIEKPEHRLQFDKPEIGNITLEARNDKDTVFITVTDDGAGIDAQRIKAKAVEKGLIKKEYAAQMSENDALMLIFEPGFSNADTITEISGRGVGMDVVKRATESIGGRINIRTKVGQGTSITLALPSSMALKGALLFEHNQQEYAVPLSYTEAVISVKRNEIYKVGGGLMTRYLDKTISIAFLTDIFNLEDLTMIKDKGALHKTIDTLSENNKLDILIVNMDNKYFGIVVDKLLQQKEIVEKPLSKPLDDLKLFGGATIMGNGNVCLVLDIRTIIQYFFKEKIEQNAID